MTYNMTLLFILLLGLANFSSSIRRNLNEDIANNLPEDSAESDENDDNDDEPAIFKLDDDVVEVANKTSGNTNITSAEYDANNDGGSVGGSSETKYQQTATGSKKRDLQKVVNSKNSIKTKISEFGQFLSKLQPSVKLQRLLKKYNGSLVATVDKQDNNGPVLHVKGIEQFWQSKDGKNKFQGSGYYDKRYNEKGEPLDRYGAKLSLIGPLLSNFNYNNDEGSSSSNGGSVDIGVHQLSSQGTQLSFDTSQNLWRSVDGQNAVKGEAYYKKQFGPQPSNQYDSIGGQLSFEGRPKVPLLKFHDPIMARARLNHEPIKGTDVLVEGNGNLWTNDNQTASLRAKAFYKQNFGKLAGHNYGTRLDFNDNDELKVGVDLKKDLYRAPQLNVDLRNRLWKSPDGKDEFEANAYYSKNFENTSSETNQKFGFGIVLNHMLG